MCNHYDEFELSVCIELAKGSARAIKLSVRPPFPAINLFCFRSVLKNDASGKSSRGWVGVIIELIEFGRVFFFHALRKGNKLDYCSRGRAKIQAKPTNFQYETEQFALEQLQKV